MTTTALILPGLGNSGPEHWQTLWERADPSFVRVQQADWDRPAREEWQETQERSLARADGDIVVVAHGLACLLVAQWARQTSRTIKGALLVAPPNPDAPRIPHEAVGFSPVPLAPLAFRSILVASTDDGLKD